MTNALFEGGRNISMRVPAEMFSDALNFYSKTLGLELQQTDADTYRVRYGPIWLWLDRCEGISQCEIRLELQTPDTAQAAVHLRQAGVAQIPSEPLPGGYDGFWIRSPLGDVALVSARGQ